MNNIEKYLTIAGLGVVCGFAFGCWIMSHNWVQMEDCIKHNAAHYDSQTAKFTWNDEDKSK